MGAVASIIQSGIKNHSYCKVTWNRTKELDKVSYSGANPSPGMKGKSSKMKVKQITEVGVVVKDLEKATRLFVDLLGADAGEIITVKRYSMRYRMCRLGNVDFELMESIGDEGVIANFIKAKGEGLHHVALAVDDLEGQLVFLKGKGVRLIDKNAQEMHGGKYAFVHPSSFLGVMFELIQYPEDAEFPITEES